MGVLTLKPPLYEELPHNGNSAAYKSTKEDWEAMKLVMRPFIDHEASLKTLTDSAVDYQLELEVKSGKAVVTMDPTEAVRLFKALGKGAASRGHIEKLTNEDLIALYTSLRSLAVARELVKDDGSLKG